MRVNESKRKRVLLSFKIKQKTNLVWKNFIQFLMQFLIYINDLPESLKTNARLFAEDVSLFSKVNNTNLSVTNLNSEKSKINAWANQ